MSLTEALDGGSDDPENWHQEELVDDFCAHERPERKLEPNEQHELEREVERNNFEDPADVHVGHGEAPVTHPVGQPCLVIFEVRVSLQSLDTLEEGVYCADKQSDLCRQLPSDSLPDQDIEHDEGLEGG